jgi:hypothetical protein
MVVIASGVDVGDSENSPLHSLYPFYTHFVSISLLAYKCKNIIASRGSCARISFRGLVLTGGYNMVLGQSHQFILGLICI